MTLPAALLLLASVVSAQEFPGAYAEPARALIGQARAIDPSAAPAALRVLTYNIQGIKPWAPELGPARDKAIDERFREIGRRLKVQRLAGRAPQIVALQEVFMPTALATLREAGYPYIAAGGSAKLGKLFSSGLYILSEFPIIESKTVDYAECSGWDCWANKGAQLARVLVPGAGAVDVYNTHLNADGGISSPEASLKARLDQIPILAAFVANTRRGPAVLVGDFNFAQGRPDYQFFTTLLGPRNALEECARSGSCSGAKDPGTIWSAAIDHQFFLSSPKASVQPTHADLAFTEPFRGKPLSDHWGLEAWYRLK